MSNAITNVTEEQVMVVKDQQTKTSNTFEKISSEFEIEFQNQMHGVIRLLKN